MCKVIQKPLNTQINMFPCWFFFVFCLYFEHICTFFLHQRAFYTLSLSGNLMLFIVFGKHCKQTIYLPTLHLQTIRLQIIRLQTHTELISVFLVWLFPRLLPLTVHTSPPQIGISMVLSGIYIREDAVHCLLLLHPCTHPNDDTTAPLCHC